MTTPFIFLLKLLFAAILLVATLISTVIVAPFALLGWLIERDKTGRL